MDSNILSKNVENHHVYNRYNINIKKLKLSTQYTYLVYFYNFWKWLAITYNNVIEYPPPLTCPKTFKDIKKPPIKFLLITPNLFFEYIGTNDKSVYNGYVAGIKASLKYIFNEFNMNNEYNELIKLINNQEIINPNQRHGFNRSRFIKQLPPPAKRSAKITIINDDTFPNTNPFSNRFTFGEGLSSPSSLRMENGTEYINTLSNPFSDEYIHTHPNIDEYTNKLLYLKFLANCQWHYLETMTPGV